MLKSAAIAFKVSKLDFYSNIKIPSATGINYLNPRYCHNFELRAVIMNGLTQNLERTSPSDAMHILDPLEPYSPEPLTSS